MKLDQLLKHAVFKYLRAEKKEFVDKKDEDILLLLNELELKGVNCENYSLTSKGNTGVKRAMFLLKEIEKWSTCSEKDILKTICELYQSENEPPLGLGKSNRNALRYYLSCPLMNTFNITKEKITDEEMQTTRQAETYCDDVVTSVPSDAAVIQTILQNKLHDAIQEFIKPINLRGYWMHQFFTEDYFGNDDRGKSIFPSSRMTKF